MFQSAQELHLFVLCYQSNAGMQSNRHLYCSTESLALSAPSILQGPSSKEDTLPEVDPPRRRLVRGSIPCRYLPPKLLSPESLSSLDESSITKHDRSIDMLEMQYPKNKDNYRNKHKLHQFTKTAVIKPKKFRSFGVDTNEQKETRNFCCQIGKSFIKRPSEES
ncbi:uncharacterized protein LOC120341005 isoform X2 [Styela clava]